MANWLLVVDPDSQRRAEYVSSLRTSISPVGGLDISSHDGNGWAVVWAAAKNAPVDADTDKADFGAFIWGEARDSSGALQAGSDLRKEWRDGAKAQWDGYYSAALVEHSGRSAIAGADLLGLFPVYYWASGDGKLLIGTSPELFRTCPAFSPGLSIEGLVGILLSNGLVDGQALWSGVRRLAPGNRVRFDGAHVYEDQAYRIPTEMSAIDLPFPGHVHQLDLSFGAAFERHVPAGRNYSIMLSGGLDSRLIAGYATEYDRNIECVTFGESQDYEMRCAKAVTKALSLSHHARKIPVDQYPAAARTSARWEMLASGFSGISEWTTHDVLAEYPGSAILGHVFDGIAGGIHIGWAYDNQTGRLSFDGLLPTVLAWGFKPDQLKSMLKPNVRDVVDHVMLGLRQEYESTADSEHYRAWMFDLYHRQRFHVGSALWATSFSAWPIVPFLDRDVVAVCAAFPCSSLSDRRAQNELLNHRFPDLATLPVDRNSEDTLPTRPRLRDFVARSLGYRSDALKRLARSLRGVKEPERIYYRRLYDMNSPEWRTVRRLAEPMREGLPDILLQDQVRQVLPDPDHDIEAANPVTGTSRARLLIGLALHNCSPDND